MSRPTSVAIATNVHTRNDVRIVIKQARALRDAGHCVTLVIADGLGDAQADGIDTVDVGRADGRLYRALVRGPQVMLRAVRSGANAVHFHDPELLPIAALVSLFTKTKFIYDVHEDVPRQLLSKSYLPSWARPVVSRIAEMTERLLAPRMDAIVTVTPTIHARFAHFHRRVVTVANYPILEEFHSASRSTRDRDPASICYVGGIAPIRGIHQLVDAMERVKTDVRLKLAGRLGDGALRTALTSQTGWTAVDELGFLDRDGVARAFSAATAGVVTFLPEPNHVAAQPNKLFEYMSAGIPVIASNFPLWREIVEGADCGICVDPTDPSAIAAAIDFLVENPDRAQEMGRNGRAAVEREYNWEREADKLLDLYRELIG